MALIPESTAASRRLAPPRPAAEALRAAADDHTGAQAAAMVLAALWIDWPEDAPADARADARFLAWASGEVPVHWPARCNLLLAARVWLETEAAPS